MADRYKVMAILGLVFIALGCLLGVVGLATSSWQVRADPKATVNQTEMVWTKGLWEECVVPVAAVGDTPCNMRRIDDADANFLALSIIILVGNVLAVIAFVLAIIWLFSHRWQDSFGCRSCVFLFAALATFMTVMPVLAYGMLVIVNDKSEFTVGWSFGVAIAGAILIAPGILFLCSFAHNLDDEDDLLYEKHTRSQREMGTFHNRDINTSYM